MLMNNKCSISMLFFNGFVYIIDTMNQLLNMILEERSSSLLTIKLGKDSKDTIVAPTSVSELRMTY